MAGATGRRCDASRTIQPDLVMHGDATWDLYISDLAYYISHRAYGHDDADGRGRSHQHDDRRPLYIRPLLIIYHARPAGTTWDPYISALCILSITPGLRARRRRRQRAHTLAGLSFDVNFPPSRRWRR